MKRFIPILLLIVSFLLAACLSPNGSAPAQQNPAPAADTPDLSRTDSQGAVTVKITPLNLNEPGDALKFEVVLDTHSVELDVDLATLATLTTDTGLTLQPTLWDAPSGGHHIEGTLSFPATQDGKSSLGDAKQLTLTILNVDNATRTFTWDVNTK